MTDNNIYFRYPSTPLVVAQKQPDGDRALQCLDCGAYQKGKGLKISDLIHNDPCPEEDEDDSS